MTLTIDRPASRQAADTFADSVGEDRTKVRVLDPQWKSLLKSGAKVDLHVTRWRAVTNLTLDDLGIQPASDEEAQAWERVLTLGRRFLLPKDIIEKAIALENKARTALVQHAFKTHWGYFVPQQKYAEWKIKSEAVRAEYLALAQDIYNNWDALIAQVRHEYRNIAVANYSRLQAMNRQPAGDRSEWIEAFVDRCMSKMEGPEYVKASFDITWDVAYIPLASMLAEDEAEAAHKAAIAQAKTEMEKDVLTGAAKQFEEGLTTFIADVKGELTTRVFNVCVDVLEALDKNNGELPRNSSKQLKNLVDAVQGLKFWDDAQLEEQMSTIKAMMDVRYDRRDEKAVGEALKKIGAEARMVLSELDRTPERKTRHIGIPDGALALESFVRQTRHVDVDSFELPIAPVQRRERRKVEP